MLNLVSPALSFGALSLRKRSISCCIAFFGFAYVHVLLSHFTLRPFIPCFFFYPFLLRYILICSAFLSS